MVRRVSATCILIACVSLIKCDCNKNTRAQNVYTLSEAEPGFDLDETEMAKFKIWPKAAIPFYIDDYSFDKVLRDRIRALLDMFDSLTGLHFLELPRPPDDNSRWAFFINRRALMECVDHTTHNFTNTGVQKVVLGYDCIHPKGLGAIVLTLAGVPPQHNAPDRDDFVSVEEANILPGKHIYFKILDNTDWLFHDVDYDYESAGHYEFHKYTSNGKSTLKPKFTLPAAEGSIAGDTDQGLTYRDVWKIRMLYNFIKKKKNGPPIECSKLFEPGNNFREFEPDADNKEQPRNKPNRYLGLPEDELSQPDEDDENPSAEGKIGGQDSEEKSKDSEGTLLQRQSLYKSKSKIKYKRPKKMKLNKLIYSTDYITEEKK